jgi:hypothetical protein
MLIFAMARQLLLPGECNPIFKAIRSRIHRRLPCRCEPREFEV